jgi:hypothetical protein
MSLPEEELLSAYLDGELSADERSRVEHLLASSSESRQLLEELRSIRASLQRMPRARLSHDFAEQVLRQAEKEFLTATAGPEEGQAEPGGTQRATVPASEPAVRAERLSGVSWQRFRRPVIWASLALAAGLLIMFLDRQRGPGGRRQVAMAPAEVQQRDWGEIGARPEPWGDTPPRPLAASTAAESKTEPRSESLSADAPPAPANVPSTPEYRPAPPALEPSGPVSGGRAMSRSVGKPGQSEADNDARRQLGEKRDSALDRVVDDTKDARGGSDGPLVVWCAVAPGTDYAESFRELLAQQNIRWEAEAEVAETEALLGRQLESKLVKKVPASQRPAESDKYARLEGEGRQNRLADAEQAVLESDVEVVLVEATQPQIEALMAAIDGAAQVFVNVDVEPSPDAPPKQQQLRRFARHQVLSEKTDDGLEEETKQAVSEDLQKREKPAKAQEAPPTPTNESELAAGTARRLAVGPSDETAKSAEAKRATPPRVPSRGGEEGDVKLRQSKEKTPSFGFAQRSQTASQDRFQVLFILRPAEASAAAAGAKPSGNND